MDDLEELVRRWPSLCAWRRHHIYHLAMWAKVAEPKCRPIILLGTLQPARALGPWQRGAAFMQTSGVLALAAAGAIGSLAVGVPWLYVAGGAGLGALASLVWMALPEG